MLSPGSLSARQQLVRRLQEQIARLDGGISACPEDRLAWSATVLDRLLPCGLRRGVLVEWLAADEGYGATTLALTMARAACSDGRALVVVDERGDFYPPAAAVHGIDLERLILVRPQNAADAAWALDQSLRCPGVGAILGWPEKLTGHAGRRWQLAAAAGGSLGLLVRPAAVRCEPSWAAQRWLVEPLPSQPGPDAARRLRVVLLRCQGGPAGRGVDLELDDDTGTLRLVAELADPTAHGGTAAAPLARHRAL